MPTELIRRSKRMSRARYAALVLCCSVSAVVQAQEPTAPVKATPPAAATDTGPAGKQGEDTDKAASEIKLDTSRPPDRFIPTEQVPEDFSVSFPVDI